MSQEQEDEYLLYPFRPREEFDGTVAALSEMGVALFEARLATFRSFSHRPTSNTIWLDPEPHEPWVRLLSALMARFPDCDDVTRYGR
jgi:hypothetical protein